MLTGSAHPPSLTASYGPFRSRLTVNTSGAGQGGPADLSAHLVTKEVRKDRPSLRVLFHSSERARPGLRARGRVCLVLRAVLGNSSVQAECALSPRDGTCLAEITVPRCCTTPVL